MPGQHQLMSAMVERQTLSMRFKKLVGILETPVFLRSGRRWFFLRPSTRVCTAIFLDGKFIATYFMLWVLGGKALLELVGANGFFASSSLGFGHLVGDWTHYASMSYLQIFPHVLIIGDPAQPICEWHVGPLGATHLLTFLPSASSRRGSTEGGHPATTSAWIALPWTKTRMV